MSRDLNKKKKSTSKYRKFKISPLIPIVAIIEVLVLIGASTYAWFIFAGNKQAKTGVITVDADSGLDIDFKYANTTDTINIWNYIDDDFTFEPATSIDGRNIFFPTSGTFPSKDANNQNQMLTKDITFREGTINDVNSKYLSIDFELTNTSDDIMDVYLKNSSKFTVKNGDHDEDSKALRLAFYPNDGSQGDVRSSMFGSDGSSTSSGVDKDLITIYYDNWGRSTAPYVYVWNSSSENGGDNTTGNTFTEIAAYPGSKMTHVGDSIYSFTFNKNYDMCIFNDGSTNSSTYNSHKLTGNLYTVNDQIYHGGSYQTGLHYDSASEKYGCTRSVNNGIVSYDPSRATFESTYNANKYKFSKQCKNVYFQKPSTWGDAYAYIWENSTQIAYRSWPGAQMTSVGADVFSYTYYAPTVRVTGSIRSYDKIVFNNGFQQSEQDQTKKKQSSDTTLATANNRLYYFNSGDSGSMGSKPYERETKTIYFYNTHGWAKPYIKAKFNSSYQDIAMTTLTSSESVTGAVYYATVPGVYDKLYFYDKNTDNTRTVEIPYDNTIFITDGYIYRPNNSTVNGGQYKVDAFSYDNYTANGNYAVISPGVSAGFQRAYNPVVSIDNASGFATQFVPAFSDSIDNYIYGSDKTLFTIEPNHMISLSMVVWLEGTDEHCTNLYAGNKIDLYLEFTTLNRRTQKAFNNADTPNYKYRFVDATREKWTSDRLSTESGVTVSPVMQLYDRTNKRGYLMKAAASEDYQGKSKVSVWECNAPANIAGNDLEFRRVNPYNESEVWNYWYCGPLKNGNTILYPNAVTLGTDETDEEHQKAYVNICTFTAFADGAPASGHSGHADVGSHEDYYMATGASASAPANSCGGLWGRFSTTTLTMIDGTGGQSIKDAASGYSSALTINYGYKVKGSDNVWRTVNIEYKASGPEKNTGYFFVIPTDILRSNTHLNGNITFKKYDHFNSGFAMNIPYRNSAISYVESYPFTDVTYGIRGEFGYIGYTNATYNYWGSDVIYLQALRHISGNFSSGCSVYVRFFSSAGNKDVQVFNNYQYNVTAGSDNNDTSMGYCTVIPCDKEYTSYQLRRTQSSTPGTVYNNTEGITIDTHTQKSTGCYDNHVSNNICSMDYYQIRIYFNNGGWGSNYDAVDVHFWGDDINNINDLYHMYTTNTTDNGHTVYQAVIPSYASIQFKSKDSTKPWSVTLNSPGDGYMYWPNGQTTDNGQNKFTVGNNYRGENYKQRNVNNSDIHHNMHNSPDWM